jgi:hypothetical protein
MYATLSYVLDLFSFIDRSVHILYAHRVAVLGPELYNHWRNDLIDNAGVNVTVENSRWGNLHDALVFKKNPEIPLNFL